MGDAIPVEDLLLLLGPDAVVLVEEVEERALGLFEGRISSGLEVSQVGEDTLFELFRVLDGSTKSLEAESQASDNIGTGDVEEVIPVTGQPNTTPTVIAIFRRRRSQTNQRTQEM